MQEMRLVRIMCSIEQCMSHASQLSSASSPAGDALQVCTTLGMLTPGQALELRAAGLSAYNHNLDTSPEFYSKITSSRKYEVGLQHLQVHHPKPVCCLWRIASSSALRTRRLCLAFEITVMGIHRTAWRR
jgi:hypothetical protein